MTRTVKIVTWGNSHAFSEKATKDGLRYGVSVGGANVVERLFGQVRPYLRKDRKAALAKAREIRAKLRDKAASL